MRPCLGFRDLSGAYHDCGHLTKRTRCAACERAHDQTRDAERGSSTQRGYDGAHRRAREALRAALPAPCGYGCGTVLDPDGPWVAAHVRDGDPSAGWLASCRACNERAKVRSGPAPLRGMGVRENH